MGDRQSSAMPVQDIKIEKSIPIIEGVEVEIKNRQASFTGKYGVVNRDFTHIPCELYVEDGKIVYRKWCVDGHGKGLTNTVITTCTNAMNGVRYNNQYKMRLVYNHFPINFNIVNDGKACEIRNFMGQKRTRFIKALGNTIMTASKTTQGEIIFTGPDIDHVSKTCALINKSTTVRNKDIRKFLDGIYESEKGYVEERE